MWKKLFFLIIFLEIIIVVVIYKYSGSSEAASVVVRPTADGPILQWTTTSSTHFSVLNERVFQPAAADTTDYISVVGSGTVGAERDEILFNIPRPFEDIGQINLWIYGEAVACNGRLIDPNKCDTVSINAAISKREVPVTTVTPNAGSYSWTSIPLNTASYLDYLNSLATTTLKIIFTRNTVGTGLNPNDNILIAAAYLELTTSPTRGGIVVELSPTSSAPMTNATSTAGGSSMEIIIPTRAARTEATQKSGGASSE